MASEAEARIRDKSEAVLREAYPDARIIHELVVRQGSCRIDLAAVTPSRIILVEIKSERDVLSRLDKQAAEARQVADLFKIVVAEKHLTKARDMMGWSYVVAEDELARDLASSWTGKKLMTTPCNAPARLEMLWAAELRAVAESGGKAARGESILRASEYFSGGEVRRRVCSALRAREFPRADPPMLSDLFPQSSRAAA